MTFIDENSSSHTAQSVTLYLQNWESQTSPQFSGAAKGYADEKARAQLILSNNRLVCEQRRHGLLYFLRRVAAPFLLLQKRWKKENCQNQLRGSGEWG